ncbi:hypothetical protein SAMN02745195_01742 [Thermoanaerobacter uzonensis DSM 18761]|jgi:hypothetical protein|uniref:Uncharacterized protein n=1 Tax=Thermoanaerobacter uzonensis DSM 18761 TaxID=1123369 RepID=A0A1M4YIL6_9THEO|nr:hypothetical protein [Thermoanaerobacter uzonensis]SHF05296.1 hypothetical protein SAMN02745195_01742 [Thermoanaerobacter uzonensis DSM 18761]
MKFIPKEIKVGGRIMVLPYDQYPLDENEEGFFILDFSRKFEDPDLSKFPVLPIKVSSKQERYLIKKYNVILGEFKDL